MRVLSVLLDREFDRGAAGICGTGQRLARAYEALHEIIVPERMTENAVRSVALAADSVKTVSGIDVAETSPEACFARLHQILRDELPHCVVFGNGVAAQEIAPRLAYRLGGSCAGDAREVNVVGGKVRVNRAVYGGKAMASIELRSIPAVVWVRARAMEPAVEQDVPGIVQAIERGEDILVKAEVVERHAEAVEGVRLEDANIIVSGGRGLGSAAPFERLQSLARTMQAEMAASRAACDLGWVPHSWQVGQSGKKVAPEFYLAIALSGSSQHLMGAADAKQIAAINIDPEAPIFKHCRFGIVEDFDKVVDLLREKLAVKLG
ncbi:MAG: Caffeyl-CoA reductase-Etf complex subunit CarE [Verrucomicrobia subdivision 3 bacterium]|nr:Caffeyl-CoA reductase-Etf complex subunit CarE [Limisphaerales bacterium]MCS1413911.1 Caffeyl-CoA reductase-Etf complex subunit CarE [Limisphaerales bacterium]